MSAVIPPWSTVSALRRLENVVRAVPGAGEGTQSASMSGVVGFAKDAALLLAVVKRVLHAAAHPSPHPHFGDDGARESARQDALDALTWAEGWVIHCNAENWTKGSAGSYRSPPWN